MAATKSVRIQMFDLLSNDELSLFTANGAIADYTPWFMSALLELTEYRRRGPLGCKQIDRQRVLKNPLPSDG